MRCRLVSVGCNPLSGWVCAAVPSALGEHTGGSLAQHSRAVLNAPGSQYSVQCASCSGLVVLVTLVRNELRATLHNKDAPHRLSTTRKIKALNSRKEVITTSKVTSRSASGCCSHQPWRGTDKLLLKPTPQQADRALTEAEQFLTSVNA